MTERVCKTCCWWAPAEEGFHYGECQLEPTTVVKEPEQRCRHHSFTTGWLETDELPEDELPLPKAINPDDEHSSVHGIDRSPSDFWKSPEHESPSYLATKVKALSERCKDARLILTETRHLLDGWGREADLWLAGDDE